MGTLNQDEHWGVRDSAARNPNTPVEILVTSASDEDEMVRMAVAANPNTPPEILEAIENHATLYEHQSNGLSGTQNDRETMLGTKEKAEIIFEFINVYRGDDDFDDFFNFNDLGVPMAVMIVNDLISLTDEGLDVFNETWKSICETLNHADPNYKYTNLDELIEIYVPFEDPSDSDDSED